MEGTRKLGASRTKLTLKLGNIPLEGKLARVAMETESGLSQFSPAGNPIGYKKVDKVTGAEVSSDQILKGRKIGNDTVTFSDAELDAAYAKRQMEVNQVRVEDAQDIPATDIKSLYLYRPDNEVFWGMIGGRMQELHKQLRFVYVEGRQEREALLQIKNGVPMISVLFFPSEVAEYAAIPAVCDADLQADADALLSALSGTQLPKIEEKRNQVIDELIAMKLQGKPIPVKAPVEAKVIAKKSAKELLRESLAIVQAKEASK